MVHLAAVPDLVVQLEDPRFVRIDRGVQLLARPGEVIAVVIQADVRVLAGIVAAAFAVREDLVGPGEEPFRRLAVSRVAGELPCMDVIRQEARVVVQHLLEMGHDPLRVRRVAVEAAAHLVVDPAVRHRGQGSREDLVEPFFAGAVVAGHDPLHRPRMGELLRAGDTAVHGVELAAESVEAFLQHRLVHEAFFDEGGAAFRERLVEGLRLPQGVRLVPAIRVRHREQDPA